MAGLAATRPALSIHSWSHRSAADVSVLRSSTDAGGTRPSPLCSSCENSRGCLVFVPVSAFLALGFQKFRSKRLCRAGRTLVRKACKPRFDAFGSGHLGGSFAIRPDQASLQKCFRARFGRHRRLRSCVAVGASGDSVGDSGNSDGNLDLGAQRDLEGLPHFCGAVVSPHAQVLVVGVAHNDGGESGRAARQLIDRFDPDACLLELDRQRFSRLMAARRGLPWVYAPPRAAKFQPGPMASAVREVIFLGLGAASRTGGIPGGSGGGEGAVGGGDDDGGGDEFFQAFTAAEACGAFVLPGDVPVSWALDAAVVALRRGLADPVGQLVQGCSILAGAVGGVFDRPDIGVGRDGVQATGVAVPLALAADGGKRAGPLFRSVLVGLVIVLVLESGAGPIGEARRSLDGADFAAVLFTGILTVFAALLLSAFAIAFLMERDKEMVSALANVMQTVARWQSANGESDEASPIWCRWTKRSSVGGSFPEVPDGQSTSTSQRYSCLATDVPTKGTAHPQNRRVDRARPLILPVRARPSSLPAAWNAEGASDDRWLPLFTAKRPLACGELRRLSLFEPRYLRLMDELVASRGLAPGLAISVAHAQHGSERPLRILSFCSGQDPAGESGVAGSSAPPLEVEVDAVLEGYGRVALVEKMWETRGEDGLRRWRLEVRGADSKVSLRCCNIMSDELGTLWVAPAKDTVFAPHEDERAASRLVGATADARHAPAPARPPRTSLGPHVVAEGGRAIRCVAVVGLLHVNGVVRGLRQEFGGGS
mmetsp:Transcript_69923/g.194479  ORF Transcript_69923/g.194479 Transcript_69923/m.194479 type:complete len:767 (+) Transcript_69923:206-2506(+)